MADFTASDGVRIHYEAVGFGQPLLLLHGLMAHGGFWAAQAPLADSFQLITPDLRGHGRSFADLRTLTVERLARDMEELAEALDVRETVVVGWSLGAAIAWPLLTGAASWRFAGSVVVDMTPKILNDAEWALGLSPELVEARSAAMRDDFAAFALAAGAAMLSPPIVDGKAALARWAGGQFARNDHRAMAALWHSLGVADFRPLLPRIEQPTLIMRGANSYLYGPETARYLADVTPNSDRFDFDRSGHAPNLEEAELFNTRIRDFAATLPRVGETQTSI